MQKTCRACGVSCVKKYCSQCYQSYVNLMPRCETPGCNMVTSSKRSTRCRVCKLPPKNVTQKMCRLCDNFVENISQRWCRRCYLETVPRCETNGCGNFPYRRFTTCRNCYLYAKHEKKEATMHDSIPSVAVIVEEVFHPPIALYLT